MGRRRPDWWSEQQQQQQQQRRRQDLLLDEEEECPRNAANARERARMRVLSKAFGRLKTTLPWVPADTKLSKLDTLRLATAYIAHLSSLLAGAETPAGPVAVTPVAVTSSRPSDYAVTWPYNVAQGCSSPEDDCNGYDYDGRRYNALDHKPYGTHDAYYTSSSINT